MAVVVVTMVVGCVLVGLVASLLRYDAELAWTSSKVTVRSKNVAAITLLFDHGGFLDIFSKIDFVVGLGRERLSSPEIEPASNTHNRHLPFEVCRPWRQSVGFFTPSLLSQLSSADWLSC